MHHRVAVAAVVLSLSVIGAQDLLAQRSGFIIGFGIGAGLTSSTVSRQGLPDFDRQTEVGFATDFKIGAQVSQSLQVYYLGRTNWLTQGGSTLIAAGISALGVTYVLPSAPVHLSGGIGLANWIEIRKELGGDSSTGFGLTGGVGWEFADLWLLDFDLTYGRPSDQGGHVNMFQARAGISILSH